VTVELEHEPGEEIQFDWLELTETPWGEAAYVLVGALSFSGRCRAVISEGMSFAHLVDAIDRVLRRLGGTTRAWRTDRMATAVAPGTDRITAQFAQAAKHYGVEVWVCPPRRPQRKGVVEKAIQYVTRSWWRTAPVSSLGQAQADLDRWAVAIADRRKRDGSTIAELADQEGLLALPAAAFPAQLDVQRVVGRSALVAFEGNHYSVSPGLVGQTVTVTVRLGELHVEILSAAGRRVVRHRRAPAGAGQQLRSAEHARMLEQAVPTRSRPTSPAGASPTGRPATRHSQHPPGCAATTRATRLSSISRTTRRSRGSPGEQAWRLPPAPRNRPTDRRRQLPHAQPPRPPRQPQSRPQPPSRRWGILTIATEEFSRSLTPRTARHISRPARQFVSGRPTSLLSG
jgi:hypothetical protein